MAETKSRIDPEMLDDLLRGVNDGHDLTGVLRQLSKQLIERVLETELTEHLGHDPGEVVINPEGNVRNGSSKKTLKGELGRLPLMYLGIGKEISSHSWSRNISGG